MDPRVGTGLVLDLSSARRECSCPTCLNPLRVRARGDVPGQLAEAVCFLSTESKAHD